MLSAATAHLGAGQAVLIFPEGVEPPRPGADAPCEPVGVVFHEPGTFRPGRALLLTSGAVASADCIALRDRSRRGSLGGRSWRPSRRALPRTPVVPSPVIS